MPRPNKPGGRDRLNLAITPAVTKRLDRLQKETEAASKTEVIQRALAVYEKLVELHQNGRAVFLRDEYGKEHQLLLWRI